jgi:hypothetical protein
MMFIVGWIFANIFIKNYTCHQLIKLGVNIINTNMDKRITPWRLLDGI